VEPRIHYVRTPDRVNIAYTSYGSGGVPLVLIEPPHVSHLQREWEMPWNSNNHKLDRLSAHRRVIRFDPRGAGLSDRGVTDHSLEARVQDLVAVVDRLELETFALQAVRNACLVAIRYAADNPHRVSHLILEDAFARGFDFWDTPMNRGLIALAEYAWEAFTECNARIAWGWDHARATPMGPAGDVALRYAEHTRACIGQADFLAWATEELRVDLMDMLPHVAAPSLVARPENALQRGHDRDASRRVAAGLPDCRFVVYNSPGGLVAAVDELLGDAPEAAQPREAMGAGLRLLLFTDLEGHTEMMSRLGDARGRDVLREHERITREALAAHGGHEVKAMGDGFLCSFGSVQRAVECAMALQRAMSAMESPGFGFEGGLRLRIGLNAGEPVAEEDDLFGTAVIAAARIANRAEGGQILVADVVRQLVAGKGFLFHDTGEHTLKGLEEPVRLWQLRWEE
jgi:class 3 adenylate cyclase/pimeloyl-ACP methyl ester carboxylesterase